MAKFEEVYEEWLHHHIVSEPNHRRRELLEKGLGYGTAEFLRIVWYPVIKNFNHLYPEWEVRDFHDGYRYLDLAYLPGGAKGGIEIQGYGPHSRDLDVKRFKDLCWRQCLLSLDDWLVLPIAFLSIRDEPERCRQLVLSFVGKFVSSDIPAELDWLESGAIRYARRLLRPFTPTELAEHLHITDRHARRLLHKLVDDGMIRVTNGRQRYRRYELRVD